MEDSDNYQEVYIVLRATLKKERYDEAFPYQNQEDYLNHLHDDRMQLIQDMDISSSNIEDDKHNQLLAEENEVKEEQNMQEEQEENTMNEEEEQEVERNFISLKINKEMKLKDPHNICGKFNYDIQIKDAHVFRAGEESGAKRQLFLYEIDQS